MVSEPLFSIYWADESDVEELLEELQEVNMKMESRKKTSTRFIDVNYTASPLRIVDSVLRKFLFVL